MVLDRKLLGHCAPPNRYRNWRLGMVLKVNTSNATFPVEGTAHVCAKAKASATKTLMATHHKGARTNLFSAARSSWDTSQSKYASSAARRTWHEGRQGNKSGIRGHEKQTGPA